MKDKGVRIEPALNNFNNSGNTFLLADYLIRCRQKNNLARLLSNRKSISLDALYDQYVKRSQKCPKKDFIEAVKFLENRFDLQKNKIRLNDSLETLGGKLSDPFSTTHGLIEDIEYELMENKADLECFFIKKINSVTDFIDSFAAFTKKNPELAKTLLDKLLD